MPPAAPSPFRPPAVPLIAVDPYFSVWSCANRLTDDVTRHWTGSPQPLAGLVRLDGRRVYRFLGAAPATVPALPQVGLEVLPTRTVYRFATAGVELTVSFLTPAIIHDLAVFSRPVTYLEFTLRSLDGRPHRAELYFEASAQLAVDHVGQDVTWGRLRLKGLDVQFCGTADQRVLERSGDDLRIDWGHLYLAAPLAQAPRTACRTLGSGLEGFAAGAALSEEDAVGFPRSVAAVRPALTCTFPELALAAGGAPLSRFIVLAYDDGYSLEYHHRKLRPYWRSADLDIGELLTRSVAEYAVLDRRCAEFDAELMADLTRSGGPRYAALCALAYRQCCAAHKLAVDFDGTAVYFSKETHSNGCINTVDVTYPSAPFFLLLNPVLLRAQIEPICVYARSPRWKFDFAPHDMGTYPKANGQVYGGGELSADVQMPVEECGDMLLLATALTRAQGHSDFAAANIDMLRQWANYLLGRSFNPEKQLCTDDYFGPQGQNTNLSVKAILALGAYAQLCDRLGLEDEAGRFWPAARERVELWIAAAEDGDHYRLAFNKPGTWSLKYNLIWDELLELRLFSGAVIRRELDFYRHKLQRFGVPLDNRKNYSKVDWTVWIACLAESSEEFDAYIDPLYAWACATGTRAPLTDWYWTTTTRQVQWGFGPYGRRGFQARSVVGGVYMKLLLDKKAAGRWQKRARASAHTDPAAGMVPVSGVVPPTQPVETDG
jgi:hypothetical protein